VTTAPVPEPIGFAPDEILTAAPTSAARLKWVVVVDADLPAGRAVNAAVCVAAATQAAVTGLLGPDATGPEGVHHPGLPWAGCSVLAADAATLATLREKAGASDGVFVADMPEAAQRTRVYDEYLEEVAQTPGDQLRLGAVSVVGPKNRVAKLVKGLPLLS
jgi:hypothetical protein